MTDTNTMGTKDGRSVVTSQSALEEAAERASRWANYLYTTPGQIAVRSPISTFTAGDLRAKLAALSTQSAALDVMALALTEIEGLPNMSRDPVDEFDRGARAAQLDAADIARQALNQEQLA